MAGKNNALEDLMMACSDLSSGSRRSGFKGPAVRDIRREAPRAVFQPSTRARDWRAFDQNLESVFGDTSVASVGPGAPPMLGPQPPQPLPILANQPVFGGPGGGGQPQFGQEAGDEWGDFQESSSCNTAPSPSVSSNNSQSIGCRYSATFIEKVLSMN